MRPRTQGVLSGVKVAEAVFRAVDPSLKVEVYLHDGESVSPGAIVMMIEGSCIDDWLHANRVDAAVEEILDFDRVVGDVLQWAEKDGETLVVVTADHATGAMTLLWGNIEEGTVEVNFANEGHNGIMVPYFAYGAGAEKFDGTVENAELSKMISDYIK
jgi:alkaline phosphatase